MRDKEGREARLEGRNTREGGWKNTGLGGRLRRGGQGEERVGVDTGNDKDGTDN